MTGEQFTWTLHQVPSSPEDIAKDHASKQDQRSLGHIPTIDQEGHSEEHHEHDQRHRCEDGTSPSGGSGLLELVFRRFLRHIGGVQVHA